MKPCREVGSSRSMALRRLSRSLVISSLNETGVKTICNSILDGGGGRGGEDGAQSERHTIF